MAAKYNGVEVFSATMARERDVLGERIGEWIRVNPHAEIVDTQVLQSSDSEYHCITIVVFFWANSPTTRPGAARGGR